MVLGTLCLDGGLRAWLSKQLWWHHCVLRQSPLSRPINCTATLKSHSSSLVETLVAKEQGGWDLLVRHSGGEALEPEFMVSVGSLSSANCSLARFHRHPPLSATSSKEGEMAGGALLGCLPDPGQRLATGPCTRTAPSFLRGIMRRHTMQDPLKEAL